MFHKYLNWIDLLAPGCGDRIWAYLFDLHGFPPLNRCFAWCSSILSPMILYLMLFAWSPEAFGGCSPLSTQPQVLNSFLCLCSWQGKDITSSCHLWNLPISSESILPFGSCGAVFSPLLSFRQCLWLLPSFSWFPFFCSQLGISFLRSLLFPSVLCYLLASLFPSCPSSPSLFFSFTPLHPTPLHFMFIECVLDEYPRVGRVHVHLSSLPGKRGWAGTYSCRSKTL